MSSEINLKDMSESVILHNYEVVVSIIAGLLAFGVGIYTAVMLRNQIKEQSKFSQRIADLEYIKLMEPKLLGIVYDWDNLSSHSNISLYGKPMEAINSAVTADWYKFHFMAGKIHIGGDSGYKLFDTYENFKITSTNKAAYRKTFEEVIAHIGTPDLKTAFETSKWAEFYKLCKK